MCLPPWGCRCSESGHKCPSGGAEYLHGKYRSTKVNIDTQVNKDQYGHKGQQWVGNGQYRSVKVNMGDTISQQRSIEVNNGHMSLRVIVCYVFEM